MSVRYSELEKIIRLHSSQNIEITGRQLSYQKSDCHDCNQYIKSTASSLISSANEEYSESIKRNGLQIRTAYHLKNVMPLQSLLKTDFSTFFNHFKNPSQNQYFLFFTKNHAMAVTVIHQNGQRYWTFFHANLGAYSFNTYEVWRRFTTNRLLNTTGSNGEKLYQFEDPEAGEKTKIQYTRLVPKDNSGYDGVWKEAQSQEESYLIKSLTAITLLKEKIKITPSISAILEGEKEDKKMNRIDTFMQISNYFHGMYEIIKIKNLLKNTSLTNEERKIVEIQQKALYSSLFFSANLGLNMVFINYT